MPRRAVDDGIPAHPGYDSTMEHRDIDLLQHVPEPAALVEAGISAVVDRMSVVPTCLRYHDRLAVTFPCRKQDLHERRSGRMRVIVNPDDVHIHRGNDCVCRLELALPTPVIGSFVRIPTSG